MASNRKRPFRRRAKTKRKRSRPARGAGLSRREQILAAAAGLFAERGYAATGVERVGEAAGITVGAVYRHFDSKLDLFRAVVEPMVKRRTARIAAIAEQASSAEEALELLVDNMLEALQEDRSVAAALWREFRHVDVEGQELFDRLHAFHTREFVKRLRQIRPELSEGEATARTEAFFAAAFTVVEYESALSREDQRQLLQRIGIDVLLY